MLKGYLTTGEAAVRLNVSAARVRQMIRSGLITKTEKVGHINMIPEREIKKIESGDRRAGRPRDKNPTDAALKKREQRNKESQEK